MIENKRKWNFTSRLLDLSWHPRLFFDSNILKFAMVEHALDADKMDLYSRQIGAFGIEMMSKLVTMNVLIVGLKGVGIECAKNLILAGPKAVTLYDDDPVRIEDLGTNFYLSEAHVGQPRARSCMDQLTSLNPYVQVSILSGSLNEQTLKPFHTVVYTKNASWHELKQVNEFCRSSSPAKPFIFGATTGVFSTIFSDFGPCHTITDPNGEPTKMCVIEDISPDGTVKVSGDRHNLDDGDYVRFEEVEGLSGLNESPEPFKIKRLYRKKFDGNTVLIPDQFKIDADIASMGTYSLGGIASQVHVPVTKSYKSFEEACLYPIAEGEWALPHMDMDKMLMKNQGAQLHFSRLALWKFQELHGDLPELHNVSHAEECVHLATSILEAHKKLDGAITVDEIDQEIVKTQALYARSELTGFCAFVGGVIAQEIVKYPGKFTPLNQWLHHDCVEIVGDSVPTDAAPIGSRYDFQISIFGNAFQEKLFQQSWFLVGAGALGCEYIKGMALMGLGAKGGKICLTDMDRIEISNLNRQFLFRRENVGQPKSVAAAEAAERMNPDFKVHCYEVPVGPDTEDQFDESFWSSLDGVWNALDNVKARRYTDSKCVFFSKPLLESGTLGTKANSEVILPFKTTCYNDHKESEQDSIPMCTLRNFPHFIEHCIEWARAQFSELFEDSPLNVNGLLRDKDHYFEQVEKEGNAHAQLEALENTKKIVDILIQGVTIETCIKLALEEFSKQFRNRIRDLLHLFPEESRKVDKHTKEDLGPFWSGEKRFPQAAEFDPLDDLHLDYVLNTANLFAFMFCLPSLRDREHARSLASKISLEIPPWKPREDIQIELEEEDFDQKEEHMDTSDDQVEAIKSFFRNQDLGRFSELNVADFEKDDDTNFHIDFITACSNLRSWNYRIKQASRHKCKMIAGKIIPALATTTAMITGLVELELYKIVLGLEVGKFANTNVNLAVNQFQSFEPLEPRKEKAEMDPIMFTEIKPLPDGFTVWDKVVIRQGNLTLEQFVDALSKTHHQIKVSMLYKQGISQKMLDEGKGHALYNSNPYLPAAIKQKQEKNFKSNLLDLYTQLYGPIPKTQSYLLLDGEFTDAFNDSCKIPLIVYYF